MGGPIVGASCAYLCPFFTCWGLTVVGDPCLMGATVPLASEICQRRLAWTDPRVLGLVFFVNTLGATAGCVLGSTVFDSRGMYRSLLMALSFNGLAAVLLGCLRLVWGHRNPLKRLLRLAQKRRETGIHRFTTSWRLAGACALAYELVLLRICVLVHEPQPATFAMVLTGYLLGVWSGVGFSPDTHADGTGFGPRRFCSHWFVGGVPDSSARTGVDDGFACLYCAAAQSVFALPTVWFPIYSRHGGSGG